MIGVAPFFPDSLGVISLLHPSYTNIREVQPSLDQLGIHCIYVQETRIGNDAYKVPIFLWSNLFCLLNSPQPYLQCEWLQWENCLFWFRIFNAVDIENSIVLFIRFFSLSFLRIVECVYLIFSLRWWIALGVSCLFLRQEFLRRNRNAHFSMVVGWQVSWIIFNLVSSG